MNIFSKIKDYLNKNLPVGLGLLAIVVNLVIEMLSRHSFFAGFVFMFTHPLRFIYGALVIGFTLSLALLFKRRVFSLTFITGIWLVMGVTNCIVRVFRHTPFTAQDFRLIPYAYQVAPVYLSFFQMILIVLGAVLFIAFLIWWYMKAPKLSEEINRFRVLIVILTLWLITFTFTKVGVSTGILASNFGNIGNAYNDYGFAYCFSSSLLNSGIDKPSGYSDEKIEEILRKIEELESASLEASTADNITDNANSSGTDSAIDKSEQEGETSAEAASLEENVSSAESNEDTTEASANVAVRPNIIFLQLESLFDPEILKDVTFSETVLPNIQALKKEYTTGLFSVPSFGAGTANTEFEVISGMNLNDFGPGEYPYKTVLVDNVCESICFDLKRLGYATNAIHDNDGTFYDRYLVFPHLGFDTFTSLEYMENLEYNLCGWADDSVLTEEILEILASTDKPDFVYAISVQGHGDYPEDYEIKEGDITAEGELIEEYKLPFTYYINQAHEMDEFVGELTEALSKLSEPTVLVFYGDHFPAFDIEDEDLLDGNIYTTRYVMWDNFGLAKQDEDIESFQLSSMVLDRLYMEGGAISKYHKTFRNADEQEYLDGLKILEYDLLYGDRQVYEGVLPYAATNLKMGHKKITVRSISANEDYALVKGKNFTEYSKVTVNNDIVECEFLDSENLLLPGVKLEDGDQIAVVQSGKDGITLSSTSLYIYRFK